METKHDFKTDKLRGRIVERYGSVEKLVDTLDWNVGTMSQKLRGIRCFKTNEIVELMKALDIKGKDVAEYFLEER